VARLPGGAGSGVDADLLEGQHGSFYQNASNLNAGTIPSARLPSQYTRTVLFNGTLTSGQQTTISSISNFDQIYIEMDNDGVTNWAVVVDRASIIINKEYKHNPKFGGSSNAGSSYNFTSTTTISMLGQGSIKLVVGINF
jgi:hypothetical protein